MKILPFAFIALLLVVNTACASIAKEGITFDKNIILDLRDGNATITNKEAGLSVKTSTKINGDVFVPVTSKVDNGELVWTTGEKSMILLDDPIVTLKYSHVGSSLKETIILRENVQIDFPIIVSPGAKLIPWYNDEWKVVSATSNNTMAGIVCRKPYGIDAAGHEIPMTYVLDDKTNSFSLKYDKEISVVKMPVNKTGVPDPSLKPIIEKVPISYPLTIDPTWVAVGDHYVATVGANTVVMWNTTGSTTWDVPSGVTEVQFLVVGAGGGVITSNTGVGAAGGGGGGEMAYNNTSALFPVSGTISITVGSGVYQGNGTVSNFSTIGANGGGLASAYPQTNYWIGFNNSAGGASFDTVTGYFWNGKGLISSIYGSSKDGGFGNNYFASPGNSGGGGGGAGVKGYNSSGNSGGNGGNGLQSNITGTLTYYAGGGGGGAYYTSGVGTGGQGGGGTGISAKSVNGTDGLGGGAGAGYGTTGITGAKGGNGVVIIAYPTPPARANFKIVLTDTSGDAATAWNWNVTNLTGNNVEFIWSKEQNPTFNLSVGNWKINFTTSNSPLAVEKTIGYNLTSPVVYFWNRTA